MKKTIKILLIVLLFALAIKPIYAVENEYDMQGEMMVEITSVEAGKKSANKEVSVDVNMKNANNISAGSIQIKYDSRLQFVGVEDKTSAYTVQSVNNKDESIIVIAFTSNESKSGDFKVCSLKFKTPEKIEEDSYYSLSFGDQTKFITLSDLGNNYQLTPAVIHCEKQSGFAWIKYIVIGLIVIIVLAFIIRAINMSKKKRK